MNLHLWSRLCSWARTRIHGALMEEWTQAALRRGDDITDLREAVER